MYAVKYLDYYERIPVYQDNGELAEFSTEDEAYSFCENADQEFKYYIEEKEV